VVFLNLLRLGLLSGRTRAFFCGAPKDWSSALTALRAFAGPTFIASVAYLDPGNFATNIIGGATHGYQPLWVALSPRFDGDAVPGVRRQARHRLRARPSL
jgi:hypothetical protein